jgi:hypothetical protein
VLNRQKIDRQNRAFMAQKIHRLRLQRPAFRRPLHAEEVREPLDYINPAPPTAASSAVPTGATA